MIELGGLLWLVAGLGGLSVAAGLVACCLQIESPLEFLLATYVLAWAWLVGVVLLLSPLSLVTGGWLTGALAASLGLAAAAWYAFDRPRPPPVAPALGELRGALRSPAIAVLALAVLAGAAYTVALALLTPSNDGDALAYHIARAAFWRQEHQLGYVANAVDLRLNINPPNAEIGQLATMLLSGSDRYVALPQLAAYGALVLCVAVLARRIGLSTHEALFGALAFATLPIVLVQASSALNDLVAASFLGVAAVFLLRSERPALVLSALAIGLAVGTKFTAPLALPTLALVVMLGRPLRELGRVALAVAGGLVLGSTWYAVNLVKTSKLDGGLAESADQRTDFTPAATATEWARLLLDLIDLSGAPRPHALVYSAVGLGLAAFGLSLVRRSLRGALSLAGAGVIVAASPVLFRGAFGVAQDFVFRSWVFVGRPETAPFEFGWGLNVEADPVHSWYGPLGVVVLAISIFVVIRMRMLGRLPTSAVGLALAPLILLTTFALTIVWDLYRGRFLILGFALAAATWGILTRWRTAAAAIAAIGVTSVALSLANYLGKPSGLGDSWSRRDSPFVSVESIWGASRTEAQTRLRPGSVEELLFQHVEDVVPTNARVALALRENDFLSPYFGPSLSRRIVLVDRREPRPPVEAEWLVVGPGQSVRRCSDAWELSLAHQGWMIERRIAPDRCFSD